MRHENILSRNASVTGERRPTRPNAENDAVMTAIEKEYALHIRGLTGAARLRVTAAMIENVRSTYELQIRRARPDLAGEALRVAVARRMYRHDPRTLALLRSLGPEQ